MKCGKKTQGQCRKKECWMSH